MFGRNSLRRGIVIGAALLLVSGVTASQTFVITSNFDADTPGSPPATGGPDEPSGVINGGVLVQTDSNGISTQPLEVDDGSCNQGYFGGVYYTLPTPVTAGGLRIEATVAVNQLTDGVIFDTWISFMSTSVVRLRIIDDGTIADQFGTVVSSYAANTPLRFRADIDMASAAWACTIDDELNGFSDDPVVSGLPFVNPPSIISQIDTVYLGIFGSFNACSGSRVVAYDDVTIFDFPPIFTDGFESGKTDAWTLTLP